MATKIRGITIDLGVDTSKLTKGLKDANSSLNSTQKQLKDVNKLLKLDPSNTTLLKQKTDLLNRAIDDSKKKLEEQKKLMEKLKEAGKTTDNQEQQEALQRDIEETTRKIKELVDEQKKMPSTFSATMQEAGQHVSDFGAKVEEFGSKMSVLSAGIAAIGGASVAAFNDVDKGYDSVIAKTGATGAELEGMQEIVDNIAGKMPSDFEEIGDAVGTVATRFHLSGDELEDVSTAFLQFASLNGTSVVSSIESVQKAMAAFGVDTKDVIPFLDQLNYVGQQTGVSMDSLATSMVSNAATLQEMGLSAEDSAQFLGQLEVSGVDASAVMSGLKKALANATAAGKDLPTALQELQDSMQNADSSTEALTEAYELFGNRAGGAIYNACKNGQIDFTNLAGAAEESATTVSGTFAETIDATDEAKIAFNNLKIAGSKLGASLLKTLQPAIKKIAKWVENAAKKWESLDETQKQNIIRIGLLVAAIGPVVTAIGKVISIAGTLMAHPIVAAVAGAAAVITGIAMAIKGAADEAEAAKWVNGELAQSIRDHTEAMNEQAAARQEEVDAVAIETTNIKELKNKYNELVGEKGEIAAKDEAEANYILETLANALGIEKDEVLKLRDANGLLGDSIDRVIQLKTAEALLESGEDDYNKAREDEATARTNIANINADIAEKQEQINSAKQAELDAQKEYDEYVAAHKGDTSLHYAEKLRELQNNIDSAKKTRELYEQDLADQKAMLAQEAQNYANAQAIIANYTGLQKATISGNVDDMEYYSTLMLGNMKTTTTGTKEELLNQTNALIQGYLGEKQAVKDGLIQVSDEQFKQEEKMIKTSLEETAKAYGIGTSYVDGIMNGLKTGDTSLYKQAYHLGDQINEGFIASLDIHSPSKVAKWNGKMYGEGLIRGLQSQINPVSQMAKKLANATNVPLGNTTTVSNSIAVYGAAGQSADSLADAVIRKLNNSYRQATKTFA